MSSAWPRTLARTWWACGTWSPPTPSPSSPWPTWALAGAGHPLRQDVPHPGHYHRPADYPGRHGAAAVRAAQRQPVLRGGGLRGVQFRRHHHRLPLAGERLLRSQQPDQELRRHLSGLWSGQHHRLHRSLPVRRLHGDLQPDPGVAGGGAGALTIRLPAPVSVERA